MVAVERMREYVNLPPEEPPTAQVNEATKLPYLTAAPDWPATGEIAFDNVWLRYPEQKKWALRRINLSVKPGCKVKNKCYLQTPK